MVPSLQGFEALGGLGVLGFATEAVFRRVVWFLLFQNVLTYIDP